MTPKKPNNSINFRSVSVPKQDQKTTKKPCQCGKNKPK